MSTRAVTALTLLVGSLAGLLLPAAAGARTEMRRFVAWEDGDPTLPVSGRRELTCDTSSYVDPRLDAWRCFGDHFIYDPCFENLAEEEFGVLLCVTSPWAKSGTLGFAALDYDDRFAPRRRPWAIRTASGRRCVFVSGATDVVRGRRLNYACELNRRTPRICLCLWGLPNRSGPTWTIFGAGNGGRSWHRERVAVAWR